MKKETNINEFFILLNNILNNKENFIDIGDFKRILSKNCEFKHFKTCDEFITLQKTKLQEFNKFLIEIVGYEQQLEMIDECIEEVFGEIMDNENIEFIQDQREGEIKINILMCYKES